MSLIASSGASWPPFASLSLTRNWRLLETKKGIKPISWFPFCLSSAAQSLCRLSLYFSLILSRSLSRSCFWPTSFTLVYKCMYFIGSCLNAITCFLELSLHLCLYASLDFWFASSQHFGAALPMHKHCLAIIKIIHILFFSILLFPIVWKCHQ